MAEGNYNEELISDHGEEVEDADEEDDSDDGKKGRPPCLYLLPEVEEDLLDWIKGTPMFWDRNEPGWAQQRKHDHLWKDKAKALGIDDYKKLKTWWKSLRTRFG